MGCGCGFVARGMRSGTVPHTLVVGFGEACEIAETEMEVREKVNCL